MNESNPAIEALTKALGISHLVVSPEEKAAVERLQERNRKMNAARSAHPFAPAVDKLPEFVALILKGDSESQKHPSYSSRLYGLVLEHPETGEFIKVDIDAMNPVYVPKAFVRDGLPREASTARALHDAGILQILPGDLPLSADVADVYASNVALAAEAAAASPNPSAVVSTDDLKNVAHVCSAAPQRVRQLQAIAAGALLGVDGFLQSVGLSRLDPGGDDDDEDDDAGLKMLG